ncbi:MULTISPECIES: hypothetical protein [Natrialbaceae]|uniref:hypothetical protein n=1 Tax=Natrialbaceae TaxID=1644061 RepID=UPI00207D0C50|nr:hypothetical protein [Natronococcus sp. CG52]
MNRRTALTLSGTAAATLVAGCLSDVADSGSTGDGELDDDPPDKSEPTDPADDVARYVAALEDAPLTDETEHATLRVELVDSVIAPDDPVRFSATLTNTTDETLVVSSGAPAPFGVVWASRADGDDYENAVTLWTDDYEDSTHVGTDGKRVEIVNDIGLLEEVAAGETLEQSFELHPETPNLAAGEYVGEIGCSVWPEDDEENGYGLNVSLSFSLEQADDAQPTDGSSAAYEVADEAPSLDSDADEGENVVLALESEADAEVTFEYGDADAVEAFVAETDFETETLVYVRGEAPQECYRAAVRSLSWEGETLAGRVALEKEAEYEVCSDAISYPATLVRLETGGRSVEETDLEIVEN